MKTTRLALAFIVICLAVIGCAGTARNRPEASATFEWNSRLQLAIEQQRLLHLYNKSEHKTDLAAHHPLEAQIASARTKLGREAVRPARAGELIVFSEGRADRKSIFNPSDDNVAFTVAIKGDEEWAGSQKASIGRETYLPAKGLLRVSNLYWTTPRMTRRE